MVKKDLLLLVDRICDEFEASLRSGTPTNIDQVLASAKSEREEVEFLDSLLSELIALEVAYSDDRSVAAEALRSKYPDHTQAIEFAIEQPSLLGTVGANNDDTAFGNSRSILDHHSYKVPQAFPRRFGTYKLVGLVGQGGMGRVYKAIQDGTNRVVALKMIRPEFFDGWTGRAKNVVQRFAGEARAAAKINHDNIITVFEVGDFDGQHFYSMQFVEGQNLADKIREGPLPNKTAAELARQIASGDHHAHLAGALHRDIKPANIMIEGKGRPCLMDFGLAKTSDEASQLRTQTGTVLGTVAYMSPEQAVNSSTVEATSDVSALGAVLYAALTGRPPFMAAAAVETLRQIDSADPVPP